MKPPADFVRPPRIACWFVSLFVPAELTESILGDLLEEFSALASKSGVAFARRWYWRQTLRTIAHMASSGLRVAPWSTVASVVGGFLLLRFASSVPDRLLSLATDRYLTYWSTHFKAYVWLLRVVPVGHIVGSMFVGWLVALVAKRREMIATMTLALIPCVLIALSLLWLAPLWPAQDTMVWLLWQSADPLAIVVGGAIVQIWRLSAKIPLTSS